MLDRVVEHFRIGDALPMDRRIRVRAGWRQRSRALSRDGLPLHDAIWLNPDYSGYVPRSALGSFYTQVCRGDLAAFGVREQAEEGAVV